MYIDVLAGNRSFDMNLKIRTAGKKAIILIIHKASDYSSGYILTILV